MRHMLLTSGSLQLAKGCQKLRIRNHRELMQSALESFNCLHPLLLEIFGNDMARLNYSSAGEATSTYWTRLLL